MRHTWIFLCALGLTLAALPAKATISVKPAPDVVVATVNGEKITLGTLFQVLQQSGKADLVKMAMRSSVIEMLYVQEAIKQGFKPEDIPDTEVQQRLNERVAMVKEKLGEQSANQLSKLLQDPVNQQRFFDDTRREILVEKVFDKRKEELGKLVDIKADDIDAFVQKYGNEILAMHLKQLVVKTRKKAFEVLDQISRGKSFDELAKSINEEKNLKAKGGDMGWQTMEDMGPVYEIHLRGLKDGQISEPIHREDGRYSLIKVLGRKLAKDNPDGLILAAKRAVGGQKAMEAMENWTKDIVNKANIEILYAPLNFPMEDGKP